MFRFQAPALASTLALGLSCAALAQSAPATPAATPAATITVTASRTPLAAERLAADLVVIDSERIRASSADSLEDLLRREAGVQLSRSGGPGQNAGVSIRGSSAAITVVLVDGVRVGSATLGLAQLEGLNLAQVERIEVLRGPGSSLHGADAVGGVVQIFTRRGSGAPSAALRLALGGYGTEEASVTAGGQFGAVDLAATLAHEGQDGVSALRPGDAFGNHNPDDDGFTRRSAQAQAGWQITPGQRLALRLQQVALNAQYDASEFLPPGFAQDNTPDFRNRFDTQLVALEHRMRWNPQWTTQLLLSDNDEDLASGGTQTDRFRTQRRQAQAQATWTPAAGQQVVVALERIVEEASSTSYTGDAERDNNALLLAYSGATGPWSVQLDLRHDDNSAYGSVDTGRAGASYALTPAWRLRALAGSTFRAPSFNDLVYPGYGVPTLQPERGRSIEFGLDGRWGGGDATATIHRNEVRNLIGYQSDPALCPPDPAYVFGCAGNIGKARLQGLTLAAAQRWGGFTLRGTLDLLDAEDRSTGQPLPRRAEQQASVDTLWERGAFNYGATLLYLGSRPDGGKTLAAETTLDLQARWRIAPQWALQMLLRNATDTDIEPARDYQGLGRQWLLALRWEPGK